ncbi:MAG TPA: hypothetical protein VMT15_05145 [Bryobacteraceae bacterium]|nr:hypothetical protein [Bryobacteraceae bacterium]
MLLSDGWPNTPEDLRVYESSILDVSSGESIDLDTKLELATEEISEIVLNIMLDHTNVAMGGDMMRRSRGVSDVVVTPQMKRWHALHTLAIFYRDAYNNQLNDRYLAKWNEYQLLERQAKEATTQYGIGLVNTPIPRAGAPVVSTIAGLLPAEVYYVQISWVSATGVEGTPSRAAAYEAPVASLLTVTNPANPPAVAAAFNVYAGLTDCGTTLQNSTPIAIGQTFTEASSGLVTGVAAGTGQQADYYITGGSALRRG